MKPTKIIVLDGFMLIDRNGDCDTIIRIIKISMS